MIEHVRRLPQTNSLRASIDEAFRAARALIDRLKQRVPIWKREHGPSGPYWVGWEDARCEPGAEHDAHAHGHSHDQ